MAASDQRNFTVHMNMGSDDNKSSLRAARPAQWVNNGYIPHILNWKQTNDILTAMN